MASLVKAPVRPTAPLPPCLLAAILLVLIGQAVPLAAQTTMAQVREALRSRVEALRVPVPLTVAGESLQAGEALARFYEARLYFPAWSDDTALSPQLTQLVDAIQKADDDGLRPEDYHLAALKAVHASMQQQVENSLAPSLLAELDLLATDAFLVLGTHLLSGRVNPHTIDAEWQARRREMDMGLVLHSALAQQRVAAALESLLPQHPGYFRLKSALALYRRLDAQNELAALPAGPTLGLNDRGPDVALLCERLNAAGDLVSGPGAVDAVVFDSHLAEAVKHFQVRHGLHADGRVGPRTRVALNRAHDERIQKIVLNLERWRWLPQELGARHILVNIAGFRLDVVEHDVAVISMRVVVGRAYRRTPVFSERIRYLVLSPYWEVPPSIAVRDKLPLIKKDPAYLRKLGYQVFRGWGSDEKPTDPATVDWGQVSAARFPFRLRQEPGPQNALGPVKFMFPNRFNVYLHGTPETGLFEQEVRSFSSGCIRVEKPLDLAAYLLQGSPGWTKERLDQEISRNTPTTVRLTEPVPIHLLYWTVWADEAGTVHFREDIYGRDKRLARALKLAAFPPS